jgi:hypothetical protein
MTPTEPGWRTTQANFTHTWQRVMTDPHGFFAEMPQAGGLGDPGTFLLIIAALDAVGHLILGWGVVGMLASFVFLVVLAAVTAALFTVIAQQLFEGRAGFEPTFRVVAYSSAPLVFSWVPFVGTVAQLYAAYLALRGIERVHVVDTTRAVLTVVLGVVAIWLLVLPTALWH